MKQYGPEVADIFSKGLLSSLVRFEGEDPSRGKKSKEMACVITIVATNLEDYRRLCLEQRG